MMISAVAMLCGTAAADSGRFLAKNPAPMSKQERLEKRLTRAGENAPEDGFIVFGYCMGLYNSLGIGSSEKVELGAAIQIPEEVAVKWVGDQLTRVRIGYGDCSNMNITVFLTKELGGDPFYTQEALLTKQQDWNEVVLDTPYEITGEEFYIGYSVTTNKATDFPLGVDNYPTDIRYGGYLGIDNNWDNVAQDFGSVCIQAVVLGDNLPQNDLAIEGLYVPELTVKGVPFDAAILVVNHGSNNVFSVDVSVEIGSEELTNVSYTMNPAVLGPGEYGEIVLQQLVSNTEGTSIPLTMNLNRVNGEADSSPFDNSVDYNIVCIEEGYQRNVVVEEWTGTWCGWCPRGIVGMNYMEETYGDQNFIGIAIHGDDEMSVTSYNAFLNKYPNMFGGYPGCVIDRNTDYLMDPNKDDLEAYYNELVQIPTFAKVDLIADYQKDEPDAKIEVSAEATFALDAPNSNYRLSFALIEDNFGPYGQSNYFSPMSPYSNYGKVPLEWWDKQGTIVYTLFNHVARYTYSVLGIARSLPTNIEKGESYSYSTTLPTTAIKDINNCKVVVLLLDYKTGKIINAAKFKMTDAAAVEGISSDTELSVTTAQGAIIINGECADATVYGIDGKIVAKASGANTINVGKGIYIVKANGIAGNTLTRKVIVR